MKWHALSGDDTDLYFHKIMIFSIVIMIISAALSVLGFIGYFKAIENDSGRISELAGFLASYITATVIAACCMIMAIIGRQNPKNDGRMLFVLGALIVPCIAIVLSFHMWSILSEIMIITQRTQNRGIYSTVAIDLAILGVIWVLGIVAFLNDIKILKGTVKFVSGNATASGQ